MKINKKIAGIITTFALVVMIAIAAIIVIRLTSKSAVNNQNIGSVDSSQISGITGLGEGVTSQEPEKDIYEKYGIEKIDKDIDWDALHKKNEDIYAWIYIPGTNVDHPILQHPTEIAHYLMIRDDGTYGWPGSVYTDFINAKDFTDRNTMIYGHKMKDGTMFAQLHNYANREFFDKNQFIYIYTPDQTLVYQIFAAFIFNDNYIPFTYDTTTDEGLEQYLSFAKEANGIIPLQDQYREETIMPIDRTSKVITLSTCVTADGDQRWLVEAVRVR